MPSGVAATADVGFVYTEWGALESVGIANQYTETYEFDSYARVSSVTRWILGQTSSPQKTYTTSYEYNLGSQLTKLIYPSGQQVVVSHDDKGRLQALTDDFENPYLSGMSYNLAGRVTGLTLGNGVAESYGYDANRLQLTTQTATKSGNQLMNLTYNYQATAGQMGQGSTAGNAGQLMGITGTINATTESAGYSYDLLGRLMTSTQTSNDASAQRRFDYDRWGNRTGVWDSVSGGNQIQSITLQQSGGVPTNRITSVTSGSTVNYVYDAAGNVTNDGAHTYKYDAENRLVKVDDGATAEYHYDHQNRRVCKIVGSSWTHYVWEGAQVIGEHDATTPLPGYGEPPYQEQSARLDYVYAGAKMIRSRQRTSSSGSWTTQYFLSDRLSVRMTLDTSGNVLGRQAHLPFGEDFGESGTQQKHHFTSYQRDSESATDYAVHRQYSQVTARFTRSDPLASSAKKPFPQSWNRYTYAANDPINMIDPWGLDSFGETRRRGPCAPVGPTLLRDGFDIAAGVLCFALLAAPFIPEPEPEPSCSIGMKFENSLSVGDQLSFEFLSPSEQRRLGPSEFGPRGFLGWFYRVEVFGTVTSDVSLWRIRQEIQTYFYAEYEDGSTEGPLRDNVFQPDNYLRSRTQQPPGELGFFAIDAPGQSSLRNGKRIKSMTLLMNFNTWAELNIHGFGRVCGGISWHVKIKIKDSEIKALSAGRGHLNI